MSRDTTTGIDFENRTDLIDYLIRGLGFIEGKKDVYVKGYTYLVDLKKGKLYSWLEAKEVDYKNHISRKLLPDECLYSVHSRTLYVFEKKFQKTAGSADEKLQTCDFKKKQYEKLVSTLGIKIKYVYILSDWFKQPMYSDVLEYIRSVGCDYRFVDNFSTFDIK